MPNQIGNKRSMGPFFTTAVRRTYVNFAQMLLKSEASAKKKKNKMQKT